MSKPAPRRASALAGAHPVDDQRTSTDTSEPASTEHARHAASAKFSVSIDPDVIDALRDAFWEVRHASRGRYRTLGDIVAEALRNEIDALAAEFNNGHPFDRRPIDHLPAGRPVTR